MINREDMLELTKEIPFSPTNVELIPEYLFEKGKNATYYILEIEV